MGFVGYFPLAAWTDSQVHVFSNFWGERCLFTILTKEERSGCSFDIGIHSTVSSAFKFGEDVTLLQSNACGRENMIKSIFLKLFMLKSKISATVKALQIDATVWSALLKRSVGLSSQQEERNWGKDGTTWCIPPCFGKADSGGRPYLT